MYEAPVKDLNFVIKNLVNLEELNQIKDYQEFSDDLVDAILEEAGKIASDVLDPCNLPGDHEGSKRLDDGTVVTPKGYKEAYTSLRDGGWFGLEVVDQFADQVAKWIRKHGGFDGLLANYWLSGLAGHRLKHELDLPLTTVFHTLARVKAETGDIEPQRRMDAETTVARCSDIILANSEEEAHQLVDLYGADISRIEIVPPGVDHSLFSPGDQEEARNAIGLNGDPVLLFVGRIQPLKGVELAIKTLANLKKYPNARLIIVGGSSGPEGPSTEETIWSLVNELELVDRVIFIPPQAHHDLCMWYRSADVLIMPSRSESFGLVALEAAACGIPVVASDVGGLRTLVDHDQTGFLVEGRSPEDFAKYSSMLFEDSIKAAEMAVAAAEKSWSFTWSATAERLRNICDSQASQALVECS